MFTIRNTKDNRTAIITNDAALVEQLRENNTSDVGIWYICAPTKQTAIGLLHGMEQEFNINGRVEWCVERLAYTIRISWL